jgi:CheY-like chemotaxis protein
MQSILLVEDSVRDAEMTIAALEESLLANRIVHLRDGAEALDYLYRRGTFANNPPGYPCVVLLDLKMPKVDGLEVLRVIKAEPAFKSIPVVMMTSSREESDLVKSYELGVNAYVVKPLGFQDFVNAIRQVGVFWAVLNQLPPASW